MKRWRLFYIILLFIILIFLGLYLSTQYQLREIGEKYPPIGEFISLKELDLHYVRKGSGLSVVMLHGRDGTLQEYTLSFFHEAAEKYDAIALDRPGYGYSGWPDDSMLSLEVQAHLIHQALEELQIENPILIGHSYGGSVVLQYLLDYQDEVRGALLLGPVSFMDEPPEEMLFLFPKIPLLGPLLTWTLLRPIGARAASFLYEQAFSPESVPVEYLETMTHLYLRPENFQATAGELSVMYDSVQLLCSRYKEIHHPVSILFGREDRIIDYRKDGEPLAELLPNAELILVDRGGHKVHFTHPDLVIEALDLLVERSGP